MTSFGVSGYCKSLALSDLEELRPSYDPNLVYKLAYKIALYCKDYFLNNSIRFEELQIDRYLSLLAEKCQKNPLDYLEETNNDFARGLIGMYLDQREYEISLVRKAIIKIES